MEEIWKPIPGWEGLYEVSNLGKIKSLDRAKKGHKGRILTPKITRYGYLSVALSRDNKKKYNFVHRLVAISFIPNPDNKPYVDHKDNNKLNAKLENLQWVTESENNKFAFDRGRPPVKSWLGKSGSKHNKSKKVICHTLGISFGSAHEAARELGLHQGSISMVCRGESIHTNGFYFKYA